MDNVHADSHAARQPQAGPGGYAPPKYLRALVDLDIDSDGTLTTRPGVADVRSLVDGRRLIAKGGMLLAQERDTLAVLDPQTGTAQELMAGLASTLIAHEWPTGGDRVFCTDGTQAFCVRAGTVQPWGLRRPADPVVTLVAGALPAASYLIACTWRTGPLTDPAVEESGARAPLRYTLPRVGGIAIEVAVPDPTVTHVAYYISRPDQEEPMLAAVVAVNGATATLTVTTSAQLDATKIPLLTQDWAPPPTGIAALGSVQAFLLAGVGDTLYRSWAGRPGLFYYGSALQVFPAPVTAIVGLQDGAWVGTTAGLYWLGGDHPATWRRVFKDPTPVIPEGVLVPGSAVPKLQVGDPVALFVTPLGLVAGLPGGQLVHLTRDVYHFANAARVSIAYQSARSPRQLLIAVTA
jgi:hypothetical protein